MLAAGLQRERAEAGAFDLVVFVELDRDGGGGVGGFPAPFADGDELEGDAFVPGEAGAVAADVEFVADADVGGGDEAGEAVGGDGAFGRFGGVGGETEVGDVVGRFGFAGARGFGGFGGGRGFGFRVDGDFVGDGFGGGEGGRFGGGFFDGCGRVGEGYGKVCVRTSPVGWYENRGETIENVLKMHAEESLRPRWTTRRRALSRMAMKAHPKPAERNGTAA